MADEEITYVGAKQVSEVRMVLLVWLREIADSMRPTSANISLILYDPHACQPEGKPIAIGHQLLTYAPTMTDECEEAAFRLSEWAVDHIADRGPGSYTFEIAVEGNDNLKHRFHLEGELFDEEEDFEDAANQVLAQRALWLRFATAALSGTASAHGEGTPEITKRAHDIAEDMLHLFRKRWGEDVADVPRPLNGEAVASLKDFEGKWGNGGERLQLLLDECMKRMPDFPNAHAFAERIGEATADLQSALKNR